MKSLVIQLARFGDLIQTKRLLKSLEIRGETHLCTDRSLLPLARMLYPNISLHGMAAHGGAQDELLDFNRNALKKIAAEHFDAVYNLNHSGLNRALARLFPAASTHGHYAHLGQDLRSPWMETGFRQAGHRVFSTLNLMDFWAFLLPDPLPPHTINPQARPGGKGIGVVLAGREARRSLPPHVLAPCVRIAFERLGGPDIHLFGSKAEQTAERALVQMFSAAMLQKTRCLCGKTTLPELADAMSGLDCLLSPDTGGMHLAAHLGVPVRAFFLSSAWAFETGPYGLGHEIRQAHPDCAPCLEAAPCVLDLQCLSAFTQRSFFSSFAAAFEKAEHANRRPAPPNLLYLSSEFDALGCTWKIRQGRDPHGERRDALRAVLAEYLGIAFSPCVRPEALTQAAALFYHDKDRMLTRRSARSGIWEYNA